MARTFAVARKPIRVDVIDVPNPGHENNPVIRAHDGRLFQPVAVVIKQLMEHGARGSLRGAVTGTLAGYLIEKKKAGSPGESGAR
jgi:hypothetical protein